MIALCSLNLHFLYWGSPDPAWSNLFCGWHSSSAHGSVKVKRGRQKGDGKKNVRKCHDKSVPSPSNPILSEGPPRPLPLMFSEVQKRGELVREVRGPKDKTNGRDKDALSWHFLSRPLPGVPFWPSPNGTCELLEQAGVTKGADVERCGGPNFISPPPLEIPPWGGGCLKEGLKGGG